MSLDKKHAYVRNNNLCSNCISAGHRSKGCRSTVRCHKCSKLHHTSLHKDTAAFQPAESSAVRTVEQTGNNTTVSSDQPIRETLSSNLTPSNVSSQVRESTTLNTATTTLNTATATLNTQPC